MAPRLAIPCALLPGGRAPQAQTSGAAGLDLHSREDAWLYRRERRVIATGVRLAIPPGYAGLIRDRSGLARELGISVLGGVIDSDYRGEIKVILQSHGLEHHHIQPGDRIAQLLIVPVPAVELVEVEELDETARADSGFGSTGSA